MATLQVGGVPRRGQIVQLSGLYPPHRRTGPVLVLLTADPAPSTLDRLGGRGVGQAHTMLLTGWELTPAGQRRQLHRDLVVPRDRLGVLTEPSAALARHAGGYADTTGEGAEASGERADTCSGTSATTVDSHQRGDRPCTGC